MRYLVNRETKEHYIQPGMMVPYGPVYDEVEADSEGWIPWSGGECPLPDDCAVETKNHDGNIFAAGSAYRRAWPLVAFYRPILTEQPALEEKWDEIKANAKADVFTRLASAVAASESIPAIIAEVNAMLPEGYIVTKAESIIAQPVEDMSDWRNWREGDLLQCTRDYLGEPAFKLGGVYTIKFIMQSDPSAESMNRIGIVEDDVGSTNNAWQPRFFRWHSRPTGATK